MVAAAHHHKLVLLHVLAGHVPGFALRAAVFHPAYAYAFSLPDGVESEADVLADHAALGCTDRARRMGQIAVEEFAERTLADETDAGRVALGVHRQACLFGDPAHLGFLQLRQRKNRARELRLTQSVQEIALVLALVRRFEQFVAPGMFPLANFAYACIVAG